MTIKVKTGETEISYEQRDETNFFPLRQHASESNTQFMAIIDKLTGKAKELETERIKTLYNED